MVQQHLHAVANDTADLNGLMHLRSLLTHIEQTTAVELGRERTDSANAMRYLVNSFTRFTSAYYHAVRRAVNASDDIREDPNRKAFWQQQAIYRLTYSWRTLTYLLYAVKDSHVAAMEKLVAAARPALIETYWFGQWSSREAASKGDNIAWQRTVERTLERTLERSRGLEQLAPPPDLHVITIPYFGRSFELVSFSYAPSVLVTGIPLYNLETPWDWQVVWHEMAGHIVRGLEESGDGASPVNRIARDIAPQIAEAQWEEWQRRFALEKPVEDRSGWVSELLEDAYSVLCLGPAMYATLRRVLRQHYSDLLASSDARHPPAQLRFDAAGALLVQMGFEEWLVNQTSAEEMARCRAMQPIGRLLQQVLLTGNGSGGYIKRIFDRNDQAAALAVKEILLSATPDKRERTLARMQEETVSLAFFQGEQSRSVEKIRLLVDLIHHSGWPIVPRQPLTPEGTRVEVLVAAASLAFEEQPNRAAQIAETARLIIDEMDSADQPMPISFELLNDDELNTMFEGLTYEKLLELSFQTVDAATPEAHDFHTGNVTLTWSAHSLEHKIVHRH